jgi:hypothetical protein
MIAAAPTFHISGSIVMTPEGGSPVTRYATSASQLTFRVMTSQSGSTRR